MKTSLENKLVNKLTMTSKLQDAIHLLQLSSLELQLKINSFVTSNVFLEIEEDAPQEPNSLILSNELNSQINPDNFFIGYKNKTALNFYKSDNFIFEHTAPYNLRNYLHWQIELVPLTPLEKNIATLLIDSISENGYLTISLNDLTENKNNNKRVTLARVENVLKKIQQLDPLGVGARNLRECLLLQLNVLPPNTPYLEIIKRLVTTHLELLAKKQFFTIKKDLQLSDKALKSTIKILRTLNPTPGLSFYAEKTQYIIPDILVYKHNNQWVIELNPEFLPKLNINSKYELIAQKVSKERDYLFLKEQLIEAHWFLKSIERRNQTLLKVARTIINHQLLFLEQGEKNINAMSLKEIANLLNVHESTISRITTHKYISTPRGVFELKYFFSSHLATTNGKGSSSRAIKAYIKNLIAQENSQKPLSDDKITKILAKEGIQIARRTISKYREMLKLAPSHLRKQFI